MNKINKKSKAKPKVDKTAEGIESDRQENFSDTRGTCNFLSSRGISPIISANVVNLSRNKCCNIPVEGIEPPDFTTTPKR